MNADSAFKKNPCIFKKIAREMSACPVLPFHGIEKPKKDICTTAIIRGNMMNTIILPKADTSFAQGSDKISHISADLV